MTELHLITFQVNEVGSDYIVLSADSMEVKIRFAGGSGSPIDNDPPTTKEEHAQFFKGVRGYVGLESRVLNLDFKTPCTINLFLDYRVDLFGWLRAVPFPFPVSAINVIRDFRVEKVGP